jgi:hypothetical protein
LSDPTTFRDVVPGDEALVIRFVRALAAFERLGHECVATEADFARALFASPPRCHALIVERAGLPIGFAVFAELARRAVGEGCAYMKWSVLDWNTKAVGFYTSLGARALDDWTVRRIDGAALAALAA